jgi:hypothetical protein
MSMSLLLLALGLIIVLLCGWAFWIAPKLGQQRLDVAQKSAMVAVHTVTAIAILAAGLLYLEEQQWSPRLGVELKADTRLIPQSKPETALVQLSIEINNKSETKQSVNHIEVSASGIRGPASRNPLAPQELGATQLYRFVTSQPNEVGADETAYQLVEIPVPCEWSLVRVAVKVPRPPVQPPQRGQRRNEYERKLLVPVAEVCSKAAP